ncbi:YncE family protein [Bacteroidota bacterium]
MKIRITVFFFDVQKVINVAKLLVIFFISLLFISNVTTAQTNWNKVESENFKIIFHDNESHLVPKIIRSAENALARLKKIFDYVPSEKIVINTYDIYDYGFGSATAVPQNFIRLEIEPLEPGYEIVPYNDRLQWIISHELVHIIVNDQKSDIEAFMRSMFSKVQPEKIEPLTVFYSLLTHYNRYTPRWHQEAIAVFLETWLSGGFGRIFSNFNEMYFRTMVYDKIEFPSTLMLDAKNSHNSFLLETLFYLYGTRFTTYLTINYDINKFISWFKQDPDDFYSGFLNKFEEIYGIELEDAWNDLIEYEKKFQEKNLSKLSTSSFTPIRRLSGEAYGWVSQPYFDRNNSSVFFAYHRSHELATIQEFDLAAERSNILSTLPSPSMHQVASTAYDSTFGYFFFTTNNNMLYRDLWAMDVETKDKKLILSDQRIGHITISAATHELWGIQHSQGRPTLVYSGFPYRDIQGVVGFNVGDEIYQLAVDPSGSKLAVILHRANGIQELVLVDLDKLKEGDAFKFKSVSELGAPENVSWSGDGKYLFWNAYTNGVSNIYRTNLDSLIIEPLSHTMRGLVKPVQISQDSLFAFEFTTEGFTPVVIPNKPADYLPAIEYMGQQIVDNNPQVADWILKPVSISPDDRFVSEPYNSLADIGVLSVVPVITGFQKQKVIGLFSHFSDPLIDHDIIVEVGYSPFNETAAGPKWHVKVKYDYKKKWMFEMDYNAPDFYDLFNDRKRGMTGTKISLGNLHYWVYDNPLKIKQETDISLYTGVGFLNDNLVSVSQPDFIVAQTVFSSTYLRKTIGSSDYEKGDQFVFTLRAFGTNPDNPNWAGHIIAEWDNYSNLIWPHNTAHIKLALGFHHDNLNVRQARFYFGGFGNRIVEDVEPKQFRNALRFPGIPIYSLTSTQFAKVMFENNLPPLRFGSASIGQHFLSHVDASIYSQALYSKSPQWKFWVNVGAQINFVFKHWFNLESTFSAGIAKAWWDGGNSWEGFLSIKLLKN